jgi:hypothetical protein
MDAQVQAAAALYLLLTPKQKDEMLALIERILAEEEQKNSLRAKRRDARCCVIARNVIQ